VLLADKDSLAIDTLEIKSTNEKFCIRIKLSNAQLRVTDEWMDIVVRERSNK